MIALSDTRRRPVDQVGDEVRSHSVHVRPVSIDWQSIRTVRGSRRGLGIHSTTLGANNLCCKCLYLPLLLWASPCISLGGAQCVCARLIPSLIQPFSMISPHLIRLAPFRGPSPRPGVSFSLPATDCPVVPHQPEEVKILTYLPAPYTYIQCSCLPREEACSFHFHTSGLCIYMRNTTCTPCIL